MQPGLLKLAHRAQRLYCDAFYAEAQSRQADKHRHMTAARTAQFAAGAEVEELVLMHFSKRYAGRYCKLVDEAAAIFPNVTAQFES